MIKRTVAEKQCDVYYEIEMILVHNSDMCLTKEEIYARLPKEIKALSREYKGDRVRMKQEEYKILQFIEGCTSTYHTTIREQHNDILNATSPQIVISETFI